MTLLELTLTKYAWGQDAATIKYKVFSTLSHSLGSAQRYDLLDILCLRLPPSHAENLAATPKYSLLW